MRRVISVNILFVCTGNTCRSPLAEAILKGKQVEDVTVRSAGIYATPNAAMSVNAKHVLDEANIVHDHQATQLSSTEVNWADLILTMTANHRDFIVANYPFEKQKVFTLKEYISPTAYEDVVDPYGGDKIVYEQTFQELDALIERLVQKIEGN